MPGRSLYGVAAAAMSADAREAAAAARAAGFTGLEFDCLSPLDLTSLSDTGRREFKHMLRRQEQTLTSVRHRLNTENLLAGDVDQTMGRLDRILETAAGLGAMLVCLEISAAKAAANSEQTLAPWLVELGRRADRYGSRIAFSMPSIAPANVKQILNVIACPHFGIDFDPMSVLQAGVAMTQAIAELTAEIRHVRGRDGMVGPDQSIRPMTIGRGGVGWQKLLAALDEAHYHDWITLDTMDLPDPAGAAVAGLNAIRRLV